MALKFRILTNGYKFRVQMTLGIWWWPFWHYLRIPPSYQSIREFNTQGEAENAIHWEEIEMNKKLAKWKVVK